MKVPLFENRNGTRNILKLDKQKVQRINILNPSLSDPFHNPNSQKVLRMIESRNQLKLGQIATVDV